MRTRAGDEPDGVIAVLSILPELDVGVVEDVRIDVDVVVALGGEHHAHIVTPVKEGERL